MRQRGGNYGIETRSGPRTMGFQLQLFTKSGVRLKTAQWHRKWRWNRVQGEALYQHVKDFRSR